MSVVSGRRRSAGRAVVWVAVVGVLAGVVAMGVWFRGSRGPASPGEEHPTAEQAESGETGIEIAGQGSPELIDPRTGLLPTPVGTTPALAFTERSGRDVSLTELKGRVAVVDFVFTSCGSVCRDMTAAMQELQTATADLGDEDGPPLQLVSFTVDPERDTPEKLTAFADEFEADADRWMFLRGSANDIETVSVHGFLIGNEEQPLFHSEKLALIDVWGRVRGYYEPLQDEGWLDKIRAGIDALRLEGHTGLLATGEGELFDHPVLERSGREMRTGDLMGEFVVLDFIFTNCPGTCLPMSEAMAELQAATKEIDDLRLVSFTVDPKRDSLEVLTAYADKHGADEERWLFLRAPELVVQHIAYHGLSLGHRSQPLFHSEQFALVDRQGKLRAYYRPLSDPEWKARLMRALDILRAEPQ